MSSGQSYQRIKAGGCLLLLGWFFLIGMGHLLGCNGQSRPVSSSVANLAPAALSPAANAQREADAQRGFDAGFPIGQKRHREGFPKPGLAYLDSILDIAARGEGDGYRVGFKGGYLHGWEEASHGAR